MSSGLIVPIGAKIAEVMEKRLAVIGLAARDVRLYCSDSGGGVSAAAKHLGVNRDPFFCTHWIQPTLDTAEAQEPALEDQVEDVDELDEIRHEAGDGEIVSSVPETFEKFGGEFSLADLTIFLMRLPRAVLQIPTGFFR
jgi:hypothetical protein